MDKNISKMLQAQINQELYSSYLYMSMSAWFAANSYDGFAKWMRVQVQEELSHTAYFINYLQDRGETIEFEAIEKPKGDWKSPAEIFEAAYNHECLITKSVTEIFIEARKLADVKSEIFLQWFISEQTEEEKTVSDIIGRLKIAGGSAEAIFMLDNEYGSRTFTMSANITF